VLRIAAACLALSGCSFFVGARSSLGITASSDGFVGLAADVELGVGWATRVSGNEDEAHGEQLSGFVGGTLDRDGHAVLEGGPRVDYVGLDRGGEQRAAMRIGISRDYMAWECALGLARARRATSDHVSLIGFEVRGGALTGDQPRVWRGFLGVTYAALSFGAYHDPLKNLFDGGKQ